MSTSPTMSWLDAIGHGHAMLVLAEDYLELRNYLGTDVHGILGYELLFLRFIVEINYDKRMMTLTLPERFKPKRKFQTIHTRWRIPSPTLRRRWC